jgi:hypothetical protein
MNRYSTVMSLLVLVISGTLTAQNPSFRWVKSASGTNIDVAYDVVVDASGNSYITGTFYSATLSFGTTILTNAHPGNGDMFVVKYDAGGNVLWARSAGGTGDDRGRKIAIDKAGNSYVTGYFGSSTITFGTTTLTNAGSANLFLVKYDAGGNVVWAKSAGGANYDNGCGIAVDAYGNIYLSGYFSSPTITFAPTTLTNAGGYDIFIVKYDVSGLVQWAKRTGSTGDEVNTVLAIDASGNTYLTGYFTSSSISFGTTTLTNAGGNDMFVAKYDASGNVAWAKGAGGTNSDAGVGAATDASGSVYVSGFFSSPTITFGSTTLTNAGGYDMYLVKYDASGNVIWAKRAGGTGSDDCASVEVDAAGNSYVVGEFGSSTITFGTNTLTNAGNLDMYVVKYDASGNVLWAKSVGGLYDDYGSGIAVDASGNIFVTGGFYSNMLTFGTTTLSNVGSSDMYIAKLSIPPAITSIVDVPNDQGGQVRIKWASSSEDAGTIPAQVTSYSVWRKSSAGMNSTTRRTVPITNDILADSTFFGYDYVESVPAVHSTQYQMVVPTLEDSTSAGIRKFTFLVVAQNTGLNDYTISLPDSGYSVDNLAPIQPSGLVATTQSGPEAQLTWRSPADPDVGHYDVYRSTVSGFTPVPTLKIGTSFSTGYTDGTPGVGMAYHYRIIAVDVHGNQSHPSGEATAAFPVTQSFTVNTNWNLISVPLVPDDYTKEVLYPTAISEAFSYQGSYDISPTLQNGVGYWLRFSGNQTIPITGTFNLNDTIDLIEGWNMIGSISFSLPVTSVSSIPGGMITSQFFGYNGGYTTVTSIEPGRGYWVKVNGVGKLVLGSSLSSSSRIIIRPISETPPLPPKGKNGLLPKEFSLQQNFPNPFNPTTVITYTIPTSLHVRLSIYNMLGQEVTTLVNEMQDAGYKSVSFDANGLPSGMYIYRIIAGAFSDEQKLMLVK